jgi:hypothetical protein
VSVHWPVGEIRIRRNPQKMRIRWSGFTYFADIRNCGFSAEVSHPQLKTRQFTVTSTCLLLKSALLSACIRSLRYNPNLGSKVLMEFSRIRKLESNSSAHTTMPPTSCRISKNSSLQTTPRCASAMLSELLPSL